MGSAVMNYHAANKRLLDGSRRRLSRREHQPSTGYIMPRGFWTDHSPLDQRGRQVCDDRTGRPITLPRLRFLEGDK